MCFRVCFFKSPTVPALIHVKGLSHEVYGPCVDKPRVLFGAEDPTGNLLLETLQDEDASARLRALLAAVPRSPKRAEVGANCHVAAAGCRVPSHAHLGPKW